MLLALGQHTGADNETDTRAILQQSGLRSREDKGGVDSLRGPVSVGFGH